MNSTKNDNTVVVYLTSDGYKLSSYYGKILNDGIVFRTLDAAKQACIDAGYDFIVA